MQAFQWLAVQKRDTNIVPHTAVEQHEPTNRERTRIDDNSIKLTWVTRARDWLTLRTSYTFLHQEVKQGPALEIARDDLAIIRWTTNTPGGTDVHYSVVHYPTSPKDLGQMAKKPIRINRGHTETTFRVRMAGLKPGTTYYYTVASEESNGTSDGRDESCQTIHYAGCWRTNRGFSISSPQRSLAA